MRMLTDVLDEAHHKIAALEQQIARLTHERDTLTARLARVETLPDEWRVKAERHKKHGDCYRIGEGWGWAGAADELGEALASVSPQPSSSTDE